VSDDPTHPIARVEDAALVPAGGPARLALSRVPRADEIADAVASARGVSTWVEGRLVVTAVPSRLVDAAGRVGGAQLADLVRSVVEPAVEAWLGSPPDIETPAGTLPTSQRPVVLGVLNVTPDSFSDGGRNFDPDGRPDAAVAAGEALLAAGADVVDVGGESSRPGADPVGEDEEERRILPVVEALAEKGAIVSVDTTKARVARSAIDAGAAMINDVSAGALDGLLLATVAERQVPYVLMHMRGTPRTMQRDPRYRDVVGEVYDFLFDQLVRIEQAGVDRSRVIVDPGIGFGKTIEHNLELLRRTRELTSLGRPVLVGTSRKSFLGAITGTDEASDRVEESLAAASVSVARGARLLRVHDVAETVRAIQVAHAISGA
jgi:dihydropteroate synthase